MCPGFRWTAYVFLQHIWDIRHRQHIWEVVRNLLHWLNFTHWSEPTGRDPHYPAAYNPTRTKSNSSYIFWKHRSLRGGESLPREGLTKGGAPSWTKKEQRREGGSRGRWQGGIPRHLLWPQALTCSLLMALSSVNVPPFGGDVGVVPIGSSQAYIWTHTTMNVGYIVASSHGTERLLSWNPVSPYIAKNGVSGNNPPTHLSHHIRTQFNRSSWRPATRVSICAGPTLTIKVMLVGD